MWGGLIGPYRKSERGPVYKGSHVLWNDDSEEIGKSNI